MTVEEVIAKVGELNARMRQVLSTMEYKEELPKIKAELKQLQSECPHQGTDFQLDDEHTTCPYCGWKR